ncbi:hypothetical protein B0I35DRAFT_436441 [Stachybotrys elegans]|uniref:Uncharacterized protein n=1 Tax=Stachybotrys elegans TaxID=80388 RepID=A0A8K0SM62_9HYPO|nr:hypothetical protein B0I35DRAFT_436441 [Stachybotrys elegans]
MAKLLGLSHELFLLSFFFSFCCFLGNDFSGYPMMMNNIGAGKNKVPNGQLHTWCPYRGTLELLKQFDLEMRKNF